MIKDFKSQKAFCIAPGQNLVDAARLMKEKDIGFVPVCDGDKVIGTLTDRDIVVHAVAEGMDPSSTTVRDAMSEGAVWCFEDEDEAVAAEKMEKSQVRRILVMDRQKRLVGVLSLGDLAQAHKVDMAEEVLERVTART